MRGFLVGVLLTALVGGLFYHLEYQYGTASACTALRTALVRDVTASVQRDLRERLGPDVPRQFGDLVVQPLTEPLVAQRVDAHIAPMTWLDCAYDLVRLDLLRDQSLIDRIRSVTVRL